METYSLFSTPERVGVLRWLLNHPEEEIRVRKLSKTINVSPSVISKYVKILRKERIVDEKVVLDSPKTRILKILLNVDEIERAKVVETILKKIPETSGVGVYGSWAQGLNHHDSDVDLWIKTTKKIPEKEMAELEGSLRKILETDVSILGLTGEKISDLRKRDNVFYNSLYYSIKLWGEGID